MTTTMVCSVSARSRGRSASRPPTCSTARTTIPATTTICEATTVRSASSRGIVRSANSPPATPQVFFSLNFIYRHQCGLNWKHTLIFGREWFKVVFCRDNLRLGEERRPLVGRISERSRSQGQRFVLEPVRFVGADLLRRQFRVDWVRYRPGTRKCFISLKVFFFCLQ